MAGSFEQHRSRIVELHRLIDGSKQFCVLMYQIGDCLCRFSVRSPRCGCRGQYFLLDVLLISKFRCGAPDLVFDAAELLDHSVKLDQGEPDADGAKGLGRHILQVLDAVFDCLLGLLIDLIAEQETDISEGGSQSLPPLCEFSGPPCLYIFLHLEQSIEL